MNVLKQQLMNRLDKNLFDYRAHILGFDKQQIMEMARHISAVSDAHDYLTAYHVFEVSEI